MPELPEIETIRRSLAPLVAGRRIREVEVRCAALRRPIDASLPGDLIGREIVAARRRAKYLLFDLDDGRTWMLHFGMSGRLRHFTDTAGAGRGVHDHVVVALDDGACLVYSDHRRFGLMVLGEAAQSPLLASIGPEPLDESAFSSDYLACLRRRTKRTIKDVLMDQRVVAGLGNIYVNELLFVSRIRPRRRLSRMTAADCARVVESTRQVLNEAIEHRGTSISDFIDGIGRRGGYQWRRRVYDREGEPCLACGARVKAVIVGQRSSYYCPCCQR